MDDLALAYLGAAISIGIAGLGGAIGIGMMVGKFFESVARQPESIKSLRPLFFVALAFIEAVVLYALVVSIILVTKHA